MPLAVGSSVDLPERVAHHAIKVLRLRSGDA
jgi:16S rRNA U1498 N3-methylase RsmE